MEEYNPEDWCSTLRSFKVDDNITLKFVKFVYNDEDSYKTLIFIRDKCFVQCKYILLNFPIHYHHSLKENSIDALALSLNSGLEGVEEIEHLVTPEEEFWAHCSV